MNLKERGVTVGDLLIISIILISTIFFINKFKESNNQTNNYMNQDDVLPNYMDFLESICL